MPTSTPKLVPPCGWRVTMANADMVELLLKRNANVHADALELARRRGHTAIVKRLEAAMAAAQSESES